MLLLPLLAASFLSAGLHAIHPTVEHEIADFVSRPEYLLAMEDLDMKMNAELEVSRGDNTRKHALEGRIKRIAASGFRANSLDGAFASDLFERGRLDGVHFEGDILLTQEQLDALSMKSGPKKNSRSRLPTKKWTTVIPYSFDAEFPASRVAAIREGIKFWQDNTCLRFEEEAEGEARIKFIDGLGCYSYLGRIGREQEISIGAGCAHPGVVTHQLGHAIGLFHTQSRPDRDRYVIINKQSILKGSSRHFDMGSQGELDDFGIPYEYGSNMHFNSYSFTSDQLKPTLVAVDSHFQYSMAGRQPTFYDVLLVNRYYGCFEAKCRSEEQVTCENGGVQDVNACSECRCPTGYGGTTCKEIDSKFKMFAAEKDEKTVSLTVGEDAERLLETPKEKFYVIQAPRGRRVEVTIADVGVKLRAPDCLYGGAMIFTANDTRLAGFNRFCSKEQTEPHYVSEGERVFFSIFSNYAETKVTITYGILDS